MVGQRDLGSSLLFFALFVVMMWVATERASYLVIGLVLFAGAAYVAVAAVRPRPDPRRHLARPVVATTLDKGYQIVQALYGLADGGIAGTGLGLGSPDTVPEAQNDFIFTAIGEELGLFGAAAVLMAYLLLIGAGLRTALRTDNTFEKLLAVGLTTIVGVQAFIIVGGVIKVVPLTGITLPFVSYGGSSLLSNYILLALLIRLSDSGARRLHELPDDPTPAERWAACRLRRRAGVDATDGAGRMNRQIRQLAVGLMVCYVVLFVALNYWQVGRKEELDARFDNTRADPPRVRAAPRPDRHRRRRRRRPVGGDPPGSDVQVPARSTRPATCSPTSPATTRSPSARPGSSGRRTTCSPATPPSSSCATSPGILTGDATTRARCGMTLRSDLQQVAKDALGEREGSVVVIEPTTGAVLAMWSYPELRPQPGRRPRLRHAPATSSTFLQTLARRPAARQRLPAALHAGLDVQGPHHRHRPARTACVDLDTVVPRRERSGCRRRPTTRSRTSRARRAAATSPRCSPAAATSRSPRSPSTSAPSGWSRASPTWGVGETIPIDLPRPAASTFGDVADLDQNLPLLAIRGFGQNEVPDGAAAHGDGRRDRRQRRRR